MRADLEAHTAYLDDRVGRLEGQLDEATRDSPAWKAKEELLRSIPGIGPVASRTLLASLPGWGRWAGARSRRWWGWRR